MFHILCTALKKRIRSTSIELLEPMEEFNKEFLKTLEFQTGLTAHGDYSVWNMYI